MRMLISRGSLAAATLVLAVGAAWAGGALPAQDAMQMLRAEFPQAQTYQIGERVTRVYGQPMTTGDGPEEAAELFIINHAEVFGVSPDDLTLTGFEQGQDFIQPVMFDRDTGDYKFYLLRYTQQREGISVFRSDFRLLVRNADGYPVVWAGANVRDLGDFTPTNVRAATRFDLAAAAVAAETGRTDFAGLPLDSADPGFTNYTAPQSVIWAGLDHSPAAPVEAVWYIADNYDNSNATRPEKWLFVADAATGAILYKEDMILFTDVSGNVQGRATEGDAADFCENEVPMPIQYARVNIGSTIAYTDANGNFTIPNGGSSAVTVQSQLWGQWFRVNNSAGSAVVLSQSVTPPGPANFMHNDANTDEYIRAQVNGYVQSNKIRDLVITHNPAYPGMQQSEFPVYVNRNDLYCPGNAWYDYSSINFCRAGSSYPNTAWSSVIHHEYGHHLVQMAGSGQDQYGEGMGDTMSVLLSDDPGLGYGFYGNCSQPLRSANNTMQYPCTGEAHACAGLLSGCVWSLRNQLIVTEPVDYRNILANLAINAMLLHTGSLITPQITIDYLTLDDDNGYIADGTPHYVEINAGFGAHNMPAPPLDLIRFEFPNGVPSMVPPQQTTTIQVNLIGIAGTPQAGTGRIYTRVGSGAFTNTLMTVVGPNQYQGTLPTADCLQRVNFYFSAQTTSGQTVYSPAGAPSSYYTAVIATGQSVIFADHFDTNLGWTVQNSTSLTDGPWERAIPINCDRGDPPADYDSTGAGYCFLTDNGSLSNCNSDVDGGYTWLISPTINLSDGDAEVSFALWYTNDYGADPNNDLFKIYVSNNNGSSWTLVRTVGPTTPGYAWFPHTFMVGDFVTPNATVKVRFEASDLNSGSVVEAAVDAFRVNQFTCEIIECPGDLNGDMTVNINDLAILLSNYGMSGAAYEDGDLDEDGDVDLADLASLLAVYGTVCS